MLENTQNCISNCLQTSKGSHVMYRQFGLYVIDAHNAPMKKDIVVQLSTYYPEVSLQNVVLTQIPTKGEFYYTVDVHSH